VDDSHPLWRYFKDLSSAVNAANRGEGTQPYVSGSFMVSAIADDVELTVSDISEEDAVLIAAELRSMGVKAIVQGSRICTKCGKRVPEQAFCAACRAKLSPG
jgi:rRNA maturation endonuclease Nob1